MSLPDQRERVGSKGVKGVSRLVEVGLDVAHQADRVHEIDYPADDTLRADDIRANQEVIENGLKMLGKMFGGKK
jgi:hypothetical protein